MINAEVVKYHLKSYLSNSELANISSKVYIDEAVRRCVIELTCSVLQTKVREEVVNYYPVPANWWEHLKDYLQSKYDCFIGSKYIILISSRPLITITVVHI